MRSHDLCLGTVFFDWATFSQWRFQVMKETANSVAELAVSLAPFLWNTLLTSSAISFGDFSVNLQTMFEYNFPLRPSVTCPDKISNCLSLTALASVNISTRVGKMFVGNHLIVCLLCSFLVLFLLTSTYSPRELFLPPASLRLLFMFWWISHLYL